MMLRKAAILVAMVFAALTTAVSAQIYVRVGPPPPRYEAPPPRPYRGAAWDPGHWRWAGGRYVWVGGHYVRGRGHWAAGHWAQGPRGWYWVPGRWM
jgi:hypothetical protein